MNNNYNEKNITSASFLVTEGCNLACTYCFEKNKKPMYMSKEIAKKGLEMICEGSIKNGNTGFHAMIFGGEPFLNPSLIEYIFSYGLELSKKYNNKFTASIITNATIMNDKIVSLLKKYKNKVNLNIQLSVDGVKEVHDNYRVTKNGKGSFDLIEKNIDKFKDIFKDNPKNLSIHGCLNKNSLPKLFESYKFFREDWGFEYIWFMPVHEENWQTEDINIYRQELTKISDYIVNKCKENNNIEEVENYAPINKCLTPNKRPNAPCSAGKSFVTITANGEIFPCHHFYFNDEIKETKIGNVFNGVDDNKRRLFLEYTSKDMTCPSTCDHSHCYRCIGVNWVYNGSILSQIRGNYCKMSKIEKEITDKTYKKIEELNLVKKEIEKNIKQNDYNEIFAKALEIIILEINILKQNQERILEKLRK